MIPVKGSSFGRAGGRRRRYPGAPRTPASWLPSAGQSQNVAPLPAGSHLQSEPQNELERTAPRPSSPGPCHFPTKAICCRIFIPALPDCPVASVVRDFCSGDLSRRLPVNQKTREEPGQGAPHISREIVAATKEVLDYAEG